MCGFATQRECQTVKLAILIVVGLIGVTPLSVRGDQPQKPHGQRVPDVIRSARSGAWSAPDTWQGGKVPGSGARVQVRTGHTISYDLSSAQVIRSVHVAGTLT